MSSRTRKRVIIAGVLALGLSAFALTRKRPSIVTLTVQNYYTNPAGTTAFVLLSNASPRNVYVSIAAERKVSETRFSWRTVLGSKDTFLVPLTLPRQRPCWVVAACERRYGSSFLERLHFFCDRKIFGSVDLTTLKIPE